MWKFEKTLYAQTVLLQCGNTWDSWPGRDRGTMVCRLMSRHGAVHNTFVTDLGSIGDPRRIACRRNWIGRRPRTVGGPTRTVAPP